MNIFHHNTSHRPVVPGEEVSCVREVEGRSRSPDPAHTPPAYLHWATSLPILLADPLGVKLFSTYLHQEGQAHADSLNFWFACNGLHKTADRDKVQQIIKAIYRRFFLKSQLAISDVLRKSIHSQLRKSDQTHSVDVFDCAQKEIEKLINDTTYPNFLKSDIYLDYVRSMQNGPGSSCEVSGGSSSGGSCGVGGKVALATLHEGQELDTSEAVEPVFPPLTKNTLKMTQWTRAAAEFRPSTEAYADYLHGKSTTARMYSSYNPVSRQDSELQSLSSDARTESDNLSLTDSSIDGMSMAGGHHKMTRKQYQMHCRKVKEAAFINRDPYTHQTVIPRTQRIDREQVQQMNTEEFAAILMRKLEVVRKKQEVQEQLDHKLFDDQGKSLAEAIRERFQIDDDDGQHILDQHVSRVWSDWTPGARSPGSPRPRSPELHRPTRMKTQTMPKVTVNGGNAGMSPQVNVSYQPSAHGHQSRPYSKHPRKEKDAFSTFSSDSGNVHDFSEGYERLHMPKSKSMPEYSESSDAYSSLPGYGSRQSREWSSARRYNKKPELTDSGVSVVSETISHHSAQFKERVMSWLLENAYSHSERDSSSCSNSTRFEKHSRSNPQSKGRRSPPSELSSLEEARRRLEDQAKNKSRQRSVGGAKCESGLQSGGSTVRTKGSSEGYTTVVFSFCDEKFPYRSKVPGTMVTLKQFKEYLPKKGNYRYFFKTECEEVDMKVIQEEITDDNEVLPLWEGKIMALVKPAD